jgi:hypothetical protein
MPLAQALVVWLLILLYGIVFYMPPWTMLAPARQAKMKHKTLNHHHNNNNHTKTTPLRLLKKPRPFFIVAPKPNASAQ